MRYLIQSSTDGAVWETRDTCDTEPQYESSLESLDLFDRGTGVVAYRVVDRDDSNTLVAQRAALPAPVITTEHVDAFRAAFPVTDAILPSRRKGAA